MGEQDNYWIIELYEDDTANVSVMSKEEAKATKKIKEGFEDWQMAPVEEASEEEMIERAEDRGFEHDPW